MNKSHAVAATVLAAAIITPAALPLAANAAPSKVYFAQGFSANGAAYKPSDLLLSGDSSVLIKVSSYGSWTTSRATGTGTYEVDRNGASGPIHKYPATFTLRSPQRLSGKKFFTRLVVKFTGKRPKGDSATLRESVAPKG